MKDKLHFEHRHIRWGRELSGMLQGAILVGAVALIFGIESPAWQRALAIYLIMAGAHSLFVFARSRATDNAMPAHVHVWHSTWFTISIVASILLYTTMGAIAATLLNLFLWAGFLACLGALEAEERKRVVTEEYPRIIVEDWGRD